MKKKKIMLFRKINSMIAADWETQEALAYLVLHGYGQFIDREESGFYYLNISIEE